RAMFISDTKEFSILRLIADDTEKAAEVLRDQNCIVSINPVIGVAVPDAPGGIAGMLRVLSETGMNVEYTYAFVAHPGERAYVVLRVTDIAAAEDILKKAGFLLITEQDIQNL
ncbi:MAG: acetolactate synthase, partial [Ruminococcus sp.]